MMGRDRKERDQRIQSGAPYVGAPQAGGVWAEAGRTGVPHRGADQQGFAASGKASARPVSYGMGYPAPSQGQVATSRYPAPNDPAAWVASEIQGAQSAQGASGASDQGSMHQQGYAGQMSGAGAGVGAGLGMGSGAGAGAGAAYARSAATFPQAQQIPYAGAGAVGAGAAAAALGTPGAQANMPTYVPPRTSMPPEEPKRKKRGVAFWIALIIALLAIAAAVVLAFMLLNPAKANRSGDLGQLEGKTAAEVQAELDRVVEEGMFNISIASVVEFADGTSEGELRIENVPNNNYLMRVEITRDDTGETIYQTDVIEPNHHIQSDVLDADLDPGSYECTATFFALDPETEDEIGQVAAAMKINVLG